MDRTRAVLVAIGLLAAILGPVGAAAAATNYVTVEDYHFVPGEVRIEPGDRVRWTNEGNQVHTVTSDNPGREEFDSGRLSNGDEFTHTFQTAGAYAYHCEVHDSMNGVVQVGAPPTTTSSSTSSTTTTQPPPTTTTTSPPATTTTVPGAPATTATTSRTPAGAESPAPTTTTGPPATTTTRPAATTTTTAATTTTVGESTTTTVAEAGGTPLGPEVPGRPPPQEEDGEGDLAGQTAAPSRSGDSGGGNNAGVILLVLAVVGAGAFGSWTLWKLRPGNA